MFYRYDEPVDMPVPELYDTGIMQMYLQAVKDQYDKGEKRMDDFISKYGDFTSPFQKDVEDYYNLGMGYINDIYDQLQAQGIDPLRSREGQMAMARAVRTVPVDKMNQIKQSATAAKAYQAAVQDAMRRGEYDPGFEQYLLKQEGIDNFSDYSTLKNGTWGREAPGIYKTLGNATNDWYDEIQPTDKGRKNGFMWTGIDMDDLLNIAKPRAQAFANTQLGGYYKYLIKEDIRKKSPLATEKELEDATNTQFIKDIANTHTEKLRMLPKEDPYAILAEQEKYKEREQARSYRYKLALARAKGELKDSNDSGYPASYTTMNNTSTTNTQNQNIKNYANNLVQRKKQYYQNILDTTKDKNSKKYKDAATYLNYWSTVEKHPFQPGKGLQPLLVVGPQGQILPSKFLRGKYAEDVKNSVLRGGSDATAKYINSYTYELRNEMATPIKNQIGGNVEQVPGSSIKCRTIDYGTGNFTYSPVKVKGMYGGKGSKVQRLFNTWLKSNHIKAYITGGTVRQDRQPGKNSTGVNTYYFDTYITNQQLKNFISYLKNKGVSTNGDAVLKHLGITQEQGNTIKNTDPAELNYKGENEDKFHHIYKFSTAYTDVDNFAGANADIDYDKSKYGVKNAFALAQIRQMQNAANALNIQ